MLRPHASLTGLSICIVLLATMDLVAAADYLTSTSSQPGLTLVQAVEKALSADPRLAAADFQVQARTGRAKQSGAFPNPEIVMEVENFEGTGNFRGLDQAELTGTLEQRIELGGKRRHRIAAAESATDIAIFNQASIRREIRARATRDFLNVLGAEARLNIALDSVAGVNRLLPALRRKTEAGAASDVDLARGQVALDLAMIDRERSETDLNAAKSQLVSNWSGDAQDAVSITGELLNQAATPLLSLTTLTDGLASHPLVERWASVERQKEADFQYEQAQRVPDLKLSAGARQIRETDDTAFLFSVSLPIPVWDRNQGAIEEARQLRAVAEAEQRILEQGLYRRLNKAFGTMTASCKEANRLQSHIIPSAGQTLSKLRDGYEQGRFGVLDVLNANTTLANAKVRHVDSLVNCHSSAAEIEYLTGINPLRPQAQETIQ